jgi:hypothetical protein
MKNYDYEVHLGLKHNEAPAKIDLNTGEVIEVKATKKNRLPEGQQLSMQKNFVKLENRLKPFLKENLNTNEMCILYEMIQMIEYKTNSLKPLRDDTSLKELSEIFQVGKNQIKKYLSSLYKLGVYSQHRVYTDHDKEWWVLNPDVAFNGKFGDTQLFNHFKDTRISKYVQMLNKTEK